MRILQEQIRKKLKEKNAVLLAHYYQRPEIQEIADLVGDSLELARKASQATQEVIVFAGVHFMAETSKILNPNKKVLIPDLDAGCSLADSCPMDEFLKFKNLYPEHLIVSYINSSAEIKALSDYICTSANAVNVIKSIPENRQIIFLPDKNLGNYLIRETGRNMLLWEGACSVHETFSIEKLMQLVQHYPNAKILAHPECKRELLLLADFVGSTSGMLKWIQQDDHHTFLIGTEAGILHQMQLKVPQKTLIPIPAHEDNSCACSECAYMKVNTLSKLLICLETESPEIVLDPELSAKALIPIQRMLSIY
ncbi:quinolinate synthetase [Algoriphagus alkaliphilus]|uniref:Quinolinate synthase n=1 Tax=Algoriphagus alkaliphilus TaxID=279824 RepID=A0A1G5VQW7_9BACT|nr:quinolinate synthase NadA [Algoriphagus alkaliphilus]MBA4301486.1 quinolinate synthase NadA [Cyclobacterium sp.]SDA48148.1 quinolinate synthetase [Algoriphagus alkaliphilus]